MKVNNRQEWGMPAYLQLALVVLLLWGSGMASGPGSGQKPPPTEARAAPRPVGGEHFRLIIGPDGAVFVTPLTWPVGPR